MPPHNGIYPTKTEVVIESLLYRQKSFHSNELIGYNRHTRTVKDEKKGWRYQIKPYSKTKPCKRGKVKIIKSSISAQFKSYIGDIPITRTIKGEKKSKFTMQERFITLLAFDNLITSSCLAV